MRRKAAGREPVATGMSYIDPPARIPLPLRVALSLVERRLGRKLLANRILTWYPKLFIGSGVMEGLVAHDEPEVPRRLLNLIRVRTSFIVSCPFCIDMNGGEMLRRQERAGGVNVQEVKALQGRVPLADVPSFSEKERVALEYVQCICSTPLAFPSALMKKLTTAFSARAIVIIAGTCAQVNFWARLIQSLGAPPAGFSSPWPVLNVEAFSTVR
ncbi:MAG TPA: carboxymuconolactone decarboxylase family protein [Spirochaetia bacterium]|nr:carboxymuconolactone decarboxylase family protein [Spirochaetia bacterium]